MPGWSLPQPNGRKGGRPRKVGDADAAKARELRDKGIAATLVRFAAGDSLDIAGVRGVRVRVGSLTKASSDAILSGLRHPAGRRRPKVISR